MSDNLQKYKERLSRFNAAIKLEPTDRVPVAPFFSSYPLRINGGS